MIEYLPRLQAWAPSQGRSTYRPRRCRGVWRCLDDRLAWGCQSHSEVQLYLRLSTSAYTKYHTSIRNHVILKTNCPLNRGPRCVWASYLLGYDLDGYLIACCSWLAFSHTGKTPSKKTKQVRQLLMRWTFPTHSVRNIHNQIWYESKIVKLQKSSWIVLNVFRHGQVNRLNLLSNDCLDFVVFLDIGGVFVCVYHASFSSLA